MNQTHPTGSGAGVESPEADVKDGRVWSTGCLLIVLLAVFLVVVVFPVLLWILGMGFGR